MKLYPFSAVLWVFVFGWALMNSCRAVPVTAQSMISFSNLRILSASGNVVFDPWFTDAFAEADGAQVSDSKFDGVTPSFATVSSGFATATATAAPVPRTGSASSGVSIPDGVAASSFATGRSSLYNTFVLLGGIGAVSVSFSVDVTASGTVFTDDLGVFANTETIFALELDGDPVLFRRDSISIIGPNQFNSFSYATTLTATRLLQFNTSYFVFVQPDSESKAAATVPESPTVLTDLVLLGLLALNFLRTRGKLNPDSRA